MLLKNVSVFVGVLMFFVVVVVVRDRRKLNRNMKPFGQILNTKDQFLN